MFWAWLAHHRGVRICLKQLFNVFIISSM
jgi:hypothetical protein